MTKIITHCGIALSLALSLAACGSGVDDIKGLAKEACACKDKACGEAVNKKLEKAMGSIRSEEDLKKVTEPILEAAVCLGALGVDAE